MNINCKHKIVILFTLFLMISIFNFLFSNTYAANEKVEALLSKKISIVFNGELKSFSDVNGKVVYPILYDGTTYLPVRALSNLFDNAVTWDSETNRILLGKGEMDTSTIKTIDKFLSSENETIYPLINKEVVIEYKEKPQTFTNVNGVVVYPLSYEGTTYLPVRAISNMYGAEINWDGTISRITIKRENKLAHITSVTINDVNGVECAVITTDNPVYDYKYYSLDDPYRLIIDLKNTSFSIDISTKEVNSSAIKSIRFGDQGNNLSRIVLDMSSIDTYVVVQSKDRCTTYLALSDKFTLEDEPQKEVTNDDKKVEEENESISNEENRTKVEEPVTSSGEENNAFGDNEKIYGEIENNEETNSQENNNQESEENIDISNLAKVTSVKYAASTNKTRISIDGNFSYDKFVLENPTRIVIDINNALLDVDGVSEITPINKMVKEIRFSQNEKDKVRIVFELEKIVDYEISKGSSYLDITLIEPTYKNIEYESSECSATLTLLGVNKKVFDTAVMEKSNKYTINYSSSKFDSGKGIIDVDDDFVKTIEIKTTKITINVTDKMNYILEQDGDDVVLTITKKDSTSNSTTNTNKSSKDDFVVLVDAGHGGTDPGAVNGTYYEKDFNLSIAMKIDRKSVV